MIKLSTINQIVEAILEDGEHYINLEIQGWKKRLGSIQVKPEQEESMRELLREEIMQPEEQNSYGTGYSKEERARRRKARSELNHYLRDKHIERKPCEICGEKAEAHHDDYNKPLDVRWLCFKHHREWHKSHENPELIGGEE